LGMVSIISVAVSRHFEDLDRETLLDKIHLIQDIVAKAGSRGDLQSRLDDALQNHPGLFVRLDHPDGTVWYASAAFRFPEGIDPQWPTVSEAQVATWQEAGREYRSLRATAPDNAA